MRKLGDKPNIKSSSGPKNAPAPKIPPRKGQNAKKNIAKPEIHPQQLNPIEDKGGQPQYKDEKVPGSSLRAMIASLKNS